VGIVCQSRNFLRLVKDRLRDFQIPARHLDHLLIGQGAVIPPFLDGKDVLIVPAGFPVPWTRESMTALQAFRQRGGRLLEFDYQIERGSLLHLEERIKELMQRNG
jgi:hypothetical protein